METGKPVFATKEIIDIYGIEEKLDMAYAPRKIAIPEGGESAEPVVVRKQHLDTNHHVNNGQFIQLAMEYLPEGLTVRQLRAEYRQQAFLEDVLYPVVAKQDNRYVVELNDEAGKPYSIVEFEV